MATWTYKKSLDALTLADDLVFERAMGANGGSHVDMTGDVWESLLGDLTPYFMMTKGVTLYSMEVLGLLQLEAAKCTNIVWGGLY